MGVRWRRISATLPAIVGWMIQGERVNAECLRGLPKGTVAVGTLQEDMTRVSLIVEHESFDEIKTCPLTKDVIPLHPDPTFRTLDQQQTSVEDRSRKQMAMLFDDLGLDPVAAPEDVRVALRNTVLGLREEVKEARKALLPLQERIAVFEAIERSRT